jgi:ABC-type transporter Mla subunit MlaD
MVAFTIVSSTLGGLYGAFEVYKDYQGMKKRITEYVAPDLSELNKKMEITMQNSEKSVQYTQDIKNDLKQDIRRLEGVVDSVERSSKQSQRESDNAVKDVRDELRRNGKETDQALKNIERSVDVKIQRALDNPLAK